MSEEPTATRPELVAFGHLKCSIGEIYIRDKDSLEIAKKYMKYLEHQIKNNDKNKRKYKVV